MYALCDSLISIFYCESRSRKCLKVLTNVHVSSPGGVLVLAAIVSLSPKQFLVWSNMHWINKWPWESHWISVSWSIEEWALHRFVIGTNANLGDIPVHGLSGIIRDNFVSSTLSPLRLSQSWASRQEGFVVAHPRVKVESPSHLLLELTIGDLQAPSSPCSLEEMVPLKSFSTPPRLHAKVLVVCWQ